LQSHGDILSERGCSPHIRRRANAGLGHPGFDENKVTIAGQKICGDRLGTGSSQNLLSAALRVNGPEVQASGDPRGSSDPLVPGMVAWRSVAIPHLRPGAAPMIVVPTGTDAPIYYWPYATVGLILLNIAMLFWCRQRRASRCWTRTAT
jgi:hypothetical protein